jgi:hypothetical protein
MEAKTKCTEQRMMETRMMVMVRFRKKLAKICSKCPVLVKKLIVLRKSLLISSQTALANHDNAPTAGEKPHTTESEALPQNDTSTEDENETHIRAEESNDASNAGEEDTACEGVERHSNEKIDLKYVQGQQCQHGGGSI